jgi:hypothetical protein
MVEAVASTETRRSNVEWKTREVVERTQAVLAGRIVGDGLSAVELLTPAPVLCDRAVAVAQERMRAVELVLPDRNILLRLLHDVSNDRPPRRRPWDPVRSREAV